VYWKSVLNQKATDFNNLGSNLGSGSTLVSINEKKFWPKIFKNLPLIEILLDK